MHLVSTLVYIRERLIKDSLLCDGEHEGLCSYAFQWGRDQRRPGADPQMARDVVNNIKARIAERRPPGVSRRDYFWPRDWGGVPRRLALINRLIDEARKEQA